MKTTDLENLRDQVRAIDEQLITLVAKRQEIALAIGKVKSENQLPIETPNVEKQIIAASRERARGLGLHEDAAEELMQLLIKHARKIQQVGPST